MANMIDYVRWRGDIPFYQVPLGEVDGLILSYLAYLPLGGIVSGEMTGPGVLLAEVASTLLERHARDGYRLAFSPDEDRELLEVVRVSTRFGGVRMLGFVDAFDPAEQKQFAAVTFLLPDQTLFIAYRGTDTTIIGWKENFNMSFDSEVPAQRDAVLYVDRVYEALRLPMRLGGHSKGGNLAAYAGLFCSEMTHAQIRAVYNYDGPGFNETVVATEAFSRLCGRIHTFVPQDSIVGILMWHCEPFQVIQSDAVSVFQHMVYSWQLMGGRFIRLEERSEASRFTDETLKRWIAELDPGQRERFVNGVYSVVGAGSGERLGDLFDGKNLLAMLKAAGSLDEQTRVDVQEAIRALGESIVGTASARIEEKASELSQRIRGNGRGKQDM